MTGLAWLGVQAKIAGTVLAALIANRSAPARQVLIYAVVLVALAFITPKIIKVVSK